MVSPALLQRRFHQQTERPHETRAIRLPVADLWTQSRAWLARLKPQLGLFFRVAASLIAYALAQWLDMRLPSGRCSPRSSSRR
jgi:hypothetical protein